MICWNCGKSFECTKYCQSKLDPVEYCLCMECQIKILNSPKEGYIFIPRTYSPIEVEDIMRCFDLSRTDLEKLQVIHLL